jgi:hypothetical protein
VSTGFEVEAGAFGHPAASEDAARGIEAFRSDGEPAFEGR